MIQAVSVVGLGSIGRRHVRVIREVDPNLRIIGVSSRSIEDLPLNSAPTQVVSSKEQAVGLGVGAAVICSPAPLHVSDTQFFLERKIPVLIEKPLSDSVEAALALQPSQTRGISALLGYTFRHSKAFKSLSLLLSERRIGKTLGVRIVSRSYLPDWRPEQDYRLSVSASSDLGGGVLLELSHEIDIASHFFGPFESVRARVENSGTLGISAEDFAELNLFSTDGIPVSVELNFASSDAVRIVEVIGQFGSIHWDLLKNAIDISDSNEPTLRTVFEDGRDDWFVLQFRHFLETLSNDAVKPQVTVEDGIAVLRVVEAARRASHTGEEVRL